MVITAILLLFLAFVLIIALTGIIHIVLGVPFVPSSNKAQQRMLSLAKLKSHDTVYDLGCGDGRLLFAAVKTQTPLRGVGYEIAPLPFLMAKMKQIMFRLPVSIKFQNFFRVNLKNARVIFCYLTPNVLPRLSEKIRKECQKGTKIISNTFHIPGLKLKKKLPRNRAKNLPPIYLYQL